MKMDQMRAEMIKGVIAFFLILNIITLGFGYYLIDSKFKENTNNYNNEILIISRKKETLLEEINIVNKSKEDIYANLKELEQNISMLKVKINESNNQFSGVSDKITYYQDKLTLVENKNAELNNQKALLQNQVNLKLQQDALLKQQQAKVVTPAKTVTPVRKTRSS